jgi:OFA family oxalate/formate antiporter-like MFS transporter
MAQGTDAPYTSAPPIGTVTLEQIKTKRIVYLAFATITLLVLGLIYAWSIFATPIGSVYTDPGDKGMLSYVFYVSMFVFCLVALIGAQIIKHASAKVAIIIAAVLLAVGFIGTPITAPLSVWCVILFYGVFASAGCGIAYNAIIALVNPWWPDKTGLCSGIQMMGFGVSSLIFGSAANALFPVIGWQTVCYIVAIVGAVLMLLLAIVVKPAPTSVGETLGLSGSSLADNAAPIQKQNILTTKVFWLYAVWAVILIACGMVVIGSAKQGAEALNMAAVGALLVGLVSTMNGLARIINGAIFDKVGLVPVMVIGGVVGIVAMGGCALAFALGLAPAYLVCAILMAFAYGGIPVMASAFARARYDAADFAKNLGIANCAIAVAAIINIVLTAVLGSAAGANAAVLFAVLTVLAVISLVIVVPFARTYKKDLDKIKQELGD